MKKNNTLRTEQDQALWLFLNRIKKLPSFEKNISVKILLQKTKTNISELLENISEEILPPAHLEILLKWTPQEIESTLVSPFREEK